MCLLVWFEPYGPGRFFSGKFVRRLLPGNLLLLTAPEASSRSHELAGVGLKQCSTRGVVTSVLLAGWQRLLGD